MLPLARVFNVEAQSDFVIACPKGSYKRGTQAKINYQIHGVISSNAQ